MSTPDALPKIELWIRNTQVRGKPVHGASWVYQFEWRDALGAPHSACLIKRSDRSDRSPLYCALIVAGVAKNPLSTHYSAEEMTSEILGTIALALVKKAEEVLRAESASGDGAPVPRMAGVTVGDAFDGFIAETKSQWSPDYHRAQCRRARYFGAILGLTTPWAALGAERLTTLITALHDGFEGEARGRNGVLEKKRIRVGHSDAMQIASLAGEVHRWVVAKYKLRSEVWGGESWVEHLLATYGTYKPKKHYISDKIADRISEALVDIQVEDENNARVTAQWGRTPAPGMYAAVWGVARELGHRIGSVSTLQVGDILDSRAASQIARDLPEYEQEWWLLERAWPLGAIFIPAARTKTKADTLLPITPRLQGILERYLATRPKDAPETLFYGPNTLTSSRSPRSRAAADAPSESFLLSRLHRAWNLAHKRYGDSENFPARRKGEAFHTLRRLKASKTSEHDASVRALAQGWNVAGGSDMPNYYAGKSVEGVFNAAAGKSPAHNAIQAAEERAERAEERARVAEERAQQAAKQAADATALAHAALQSSKNGQPHSRRRKRQ